MFSIGFFNSREHLFFYYIIFSGIKCFTQNKFFTFNCFLSNQWLDKVWKLFFYLNISRSTIVINYCPTVHRPKPQNPAKENLNFNYFNCAQRKPIFIVKYETIKLEIHFLQTGSAHPPCLCGCVSGPKLQFPVCPEGWAVEEEDNLSHFELHLLPD